MSKPALIAVDLQREFVKPNPDLLSRVKNLVTEWPEQDVYWMRYFNHPDSMFVKYLDWVEAIDSPEAGLIWWGG